MIIIIVFLCGSVKMIHLILYIILLAIPVDGRNAQTKSLDITQDIFRLAGTTAVLISTLMIIFKW